ncbi:hypothetical protein ACFQ67_01810 [Streptomyces sp. NPDC056488]|uniref:hypothetical protein n=1 Tax=Streptomyces sp. NPDC056488 TaxID=3345836 RepID=UPI0036AFEB5A
MTALLAVRLAVASVVSTLVDAYWWTTGHPATEFAVPTGPNQYLLPETVTAVEESVAASTRRMYGADRQVRSPLDARPKAAQWCRPPAIRW